MGQFFKYLPQCFILISFCFSVEAANFYAGVDERSLNDPYCDRDEIARPFYELKKALIKLGYDVKKPRMPFKEIFGPSDYFFSINIPGQPFLNELKEGRERCIGSIWEPPTVCMDFYNRDFRPYIAKILVMADDQVDNDHFVKFFYPQPHLEMIKNIPKFSKKKLCTLIAGNKYSGYPLELYSERRNIIRFFQKFHKGDFDFYGPGWHKGACYKGTVKTKKDVLKHYRFCICYENTRDFDGYITEKIFDCFVAGCIPIYRGAGNITSYVPKNCFIDRREFASDEQLYTCLKKMDKNTYKNYLANIRTYLASEKAFLFSTEYFIDTIVSLMLPGYDKALIFNERQIAMLEAARSYYESIRT